MKPLSFVLALAVSLLGCDDGPGKAWLVDRTRVLGARVALESDPTRASIAPGETARVEWLIASPGAQPRLSWSFAVCVPPAGNTALPRCDGPVLAFGSGTTEGATEPGMSVRVPSGGAIPEAAPELLVIAAFCESEVATLDARAFVATCAGGVEPLLASATMRLAAAGPNDNPSIADDAIRLDGVVVPPAVLEPSGAPCTPAPDRPFAAAGGGERAVVFRFRGDEREPGEALDLAHVVTAGKLDRERSSLEPDETVPRDVTIEWTPPPLEEVSDAGRLVEMFFVLRDGRGGTAYARRTICVRRSQ
jgi:hypothetical protein